MEKTTAQPLGAPVATAATPRSPRRYKKRSTTRRSAPRAAAIPPVEKPKLGLPDALEAARETARNAQEGNIKLCRSVDALRTGLETIAQAEWDNKANAPVSAADLRVLAIGTLDEYSRQTGQPWRRNPLVGSYAGDRTGLPHQDIVAPPQARPR